MSKRNWLWRNWNKRPLWEGLPYSDVKKAKNFLTQQYTEMASENKFGFDEVVDTVVDLVKAEARAHTVFEGKFDIGRAVTWAIGEYGTIKEAVQDWPVFVQEVTDLMAEEGVQALDVINRALSDGEKEKSYIYKLVVFGVIGYKNTVTVIELGKQQLELGAAIFAKR